MNYYKVIDGSKTSQSIWKPTQCCYCKNPFTSTDFQLKKYHLTKFILSFGLLVMLFHKKCWTKFKQANKKAWEQFINDPIYRWSMGVKD